MEGIVSRYFEAAGVLWILSFTSGFRNAVAHRCKQSPANQRYREPAYFSQKLG